MNTPSQDTITKLQSMQGSLWANVASAVSASAGLSVSFGDSIAVSSAPADIPSEFGGSQVVISFGLDGDSGGEQVIILPTNVAAALIAGKAEATAETLEQDHLDSAAEIFQAIVAEIGKAASASRSATVSPGEVRVTLDVLEVPSGFNECVELGRVQTPIEIGDSHGVLVWLMHADTTYFLTNTEAEDTDDQTIQFTDHAGGRSNDSRIQLILDVPLRVSVELGRVEMLIEDILELGTGSIIEIDKAAGEPVDVLVNGKVVAKGEVVVIEDNFGVRITEIVSPKDRVTSLSEAA